MLTGEWKVKLLMVVHANEGKVFPFRFQYNAVFQLTKQGFDRYQWFNNKIIITTITTKIIKYNFKLLIISSINVFGQTVPENQKG